jgi:hypothetical protein
MPLLLGKNLARGGKGELNDVRFRKLLLALRLQSNTHFILSF